MPYKDLDKQRQYVKDDQIRRRELVRKIIREAKAKPCADCGKEYPYYVMEFDHVRGKKAYALAKVVQRPSNKAIEDLPGEIAKCDVVCANCHRLRHEGKCGPNDMVYVA